jgi:hypothetical protein
MDDKRMQTLTDDVRFAAEQISQELGWEASARKTNSRAA